MGKTLGYTIDELKERPYIDFVHPDDRMMTTVQGETAIAAFHSSFLASNTDQ
jgi:hypothetical protein